MAKKKSHKKSASKKHLLRKAVAKKVTTRKTSRKKIAKKTAVRKTGPRAGIVGERLTLSSIKNVDLTQLKHRVRANPALAGMFGFINTFLQASEYEVIQMMAHSGVWQGTVPPDPGGKGMVEFGLLDYWLNNPGNNKYLLWLKKIWPLVVGK